jgi:hypothetical protein
MSFQEWKEDLENRLNDHLKNRLDKTAPQEIATSRLQVQVTESKLIRGNWFVWLNGKIVQKFTGSTAHLDATACAAYLLRKEIEQQIEDPFPCKSCGGSTAHRPGCSLLGQGSNI